jgi:N-acetylneuraminic acid mutarotase
MYNNSLIRVCTSTVLVIMAVALFVSCGSKNPGPGAQWVRKSDFPSSGFEQAPWFVIGTKAYLLDNAKTTWEYDQATDKWTSKSKLVSSTDKDQSFTFAINGKGYVGCGGGVIETQDFWIYDPTLDQWTQKTDFPGGKRYGAVAGVVNGKAYVISGYSYNGSSGNYMQDVWQYDPTTDQWTQKANMPAAGRTDGASFAIGDKIYFGSGYNPTQLNVILNDFWEYTPATDTWVQKKDFVGTPRYTSVSFAIGSKGYMGTGFQSNQPNALSDFWEYNPSSDSWTQKAIVGKTPRYDAAGFAIGNTAYIGDGADTYDYDIVTNSSGYQSYSYYLWSYNP